MYTYFYFNAKTVQFCVVAGRHGGDISKVCFTGARSCSTKARSCSTLLRSLLLAHKFITAQRNECLSEVMGKFNLQLRIILFYSTCERNQPSPSAHLLKYATKECKLYLYLWIEPFQAYYPGQFFLKNFNQFCFQTIHFPQALKFFTCTACYASDFENVTLNTFLIPAKIGKLRTPFFKVWKINWLSNNFGILSSDFCLGNIQASENSQQWTY